MTFAWKISLLQTICFSSLYALDWCVLRRLEPDKLNRFLKAFGLGTPGK